MPLAGEDGTSDMMLDLSIFKYAKYIREVSPLDLFGQESPTDACFIDYRVEMHRSNRRGERQAFG